MRGTINPSLASHSPCPSEQGIWGWGSFPHPQEGQLRLGNKMWAQEPPAARRDRLTWYGDGMESP